MKITISDKLVDPGPLTDEITILCSKQFRELIDLVCRLTDSDISDLGHRYLLEGMIRDLKRSFEVEPYLDKTLRELLKSKKKGGIKHGNCNTF